MADSFQGMMKNRGTGGTRARLTKFYQEQGYSPEAAAGLAAAEMARQDRQARINAPEAGFTGQQGDIVQRAAQLSAQEPGYYGQSGRTLQYSVNPRSLGEGEPAPQMDQFRETAPTAQDIAAQQGRASAQAEADRQRETSMPWYEMPAYRNEASAIEARRQAELDFERNLRENSARVGQLADQQRQRDVDVARQALDTRRLDAVTAPSATRSDASPAGGAATTPAASSTVTDRVSPDAQADIARQSSMLPMFASPNWGAYPVAPNVQDRSVTPGLLAMAGQRIAPYATQFSNADLMRFSTDKAPAAAPSPPPRRAAPAAAPAAAAAQQQAPAQGGNFFSRLFSGPQYQSTGQEVVQRTQNMPRQGGDRRQGQDLPVARLNWGDRDSAADFFRADQARQELEKNKEAFTGMKRGGTAQAPGKDAALHKALEIIHHMLTRGR